MNQKRKFRRTTLISAGLLAFLTGLFASKNIAIQIDFALVLVSLLALLVARKHTFGLLAAALLAGLVFGFWRGGMTKQQLTKYDQLIGQSVTIEGHVVDDPVYDDQGRLDFRLGSLVIDEKAAIGQVRIKAHINGVRRGDQVRASGMLREGFGNYQASMYYGSAAVLGQTGNPVESLRREFFASVYSVLPEPQASLGLGFLVGLRSALPEDLDDQLRIAGLTHIVVASGYNLTILVRLSRRLLSRYSKYQALAGSIALILMFLAITGASPSMVRASVVTVLSLGAWYYGRKFQPVLIILLGAALTAGFNPLYIWYDLGWWLSFLAFAGVLIIAPLVQARFYGERSPPLLVQIGVETIAAQIMATPLILFVFGDISVVAIAANLAVVPLIPFAMLATFIAGMAGLILDASIAPLLGVPANFILSYIVEATQAFASFSWAQQSLQISAAAMVAFYTAVFIGVLLLVRIGRKKLADLPSIVE